MFRCYLCGQLIPLVPFTLPSPRPGGGGACAGRVVLHRPRESSHVTPELGQVPVQNLHTALHIYAVTCGTFTELTSPALRLKQLEMVSFSMNKYPFKFE